MKTNTSVLAKSSALLLLLIFCLSLVHTHHYTDTPTHTERFMSVFITLPSAAGHYRNKKELWKELNS